MKEPVLVILAAGIGSRYGGGGLKQIDPMGQHGEKIIDYSLYDAYKAGFKKAVFIIREEMLPDFEEDVFARAGKYLEIAYAFQKQDDIPEGFTVPEGRVKPWGTAHAALCASPVLGDAPYCVINADDFYGREAFKKIYDFLVNAEDGEVMDFAMVGYYLKNTVTEHGFVSRGVCEIENGVLKSVTERLHIEKREDGIAYTEDDGETWNRLDGDTIVSMNFWGFTSGFTKAAKEDYVKFFREKVPQNPMKAEFLLPFVVDDLVKAGKARVTALSSADKWFGVTYLEDKPKVMAGIRELTEKGVYPSPLWG